MALRINVRQWDKNLIKFTARTRYISLTLIAKKPRQKVLPKGKKSIFEIFLRNFYSLKQGCSVGEKVS